jgi:hypothetical protein
VRGALALVPQFERQGSKLQVVLPLSVVFSCSVVSVAVQEALP